MREDFFSSLNRTSILIEFYSMIFYRWEFHLPFLFELLTKRCQKDRFCLNSWSTNVREERENVNKVCPKVRRNFWINIHFLIDFFLIFSLLDKFGLDRFLRQMFSVGKQRKRCEMTKDFFLFVSNRNSNDKIRWRTICFSSIKTVGVDEQIRNNKNLDQSKHFRWVFWRIRFRRWRSTWWSNEKTIRIFSLINIDVQWRTSIDRF